MSRLRVARSLSNKVTRGERGDLSTGMELQFAQDVLHMARCGALCNRECLGNLTVRGKTTTQKCHDLTFTTRELFSRPMGQRVRCLGVSPWRRRSKSGANNFWNGQVPSRAECRKHSDLAEHTPTLLE